MLDECIMKKVYNAEWSKNDTEAYNHNISYNICYVKWAYNVKWTYNVKSAFNVKWA